MSHWRPATSRRLIRPPEFVSGVGWSHPAQSDQHVQPDALRSRRDQSAVKRAMNPFRVERLSQRIRVRGKCGI
jgi:hypothetical protein